VAVKAKLRANEASVLRYLYEHHLLLVPVNDIPAGAPAKTSGH